MLCADCCSVKSILKFDDRMTHPVAQPEMKLMDSRRRLKCKFAMFKIMDRRKFWLGGAAPQTPQFLAGGAKPPQTPPLNGRSSHLIEAAKRGRLDQMIFFSAPLTTRAPPTTVRRPPAGACDMKKKRKVGFTKSRFLRTVNSYIRRKTSSC